MFSAQRHLVDSQDFWKIFCGLTRQKWNILEGVHPDTFGVKLTVFQKKIVIPRARHGGGSVMVWGCFVASGPHSVLFCAKWHMRQQDVQDLEDLV